MRLPSDALLLIIDDRDENAAGSDELRSADRDVRARGAALLEAWHAAGLNSVRVGASVEELHGSTGAAGRRIKHPASLLARPRSTKSALSVELEADLSDRGCTTLVVCGFETDGGVEATVRQAVDLGYRLFVVADACAARSMVDWRGRSWSAQDVHALAIARMAASDVLIVETRTAWIAAKSAGWGRR